MTRALLGFAVDPARPFLYGAATLHELWARSWILPSVVECFLFETDQVEAHPVDEAHPPMEWFPICELPFLFWPDQRKRVAGVSQQK